MRTFILIMLLVAVSVGATSQYVSSQTRAQEIAASFNKFKRAVKEKNGVRIQKYKDVQTELVIKQNKTDYSGVYEVADLGFAITIQASSDGRVQGNGSDRTLGSFRLENGRIEGALLTATSVYDNGTAEKFEAVFLTRTERTSPTDSGMTTFGLGVVLETPIEANGNTYDKLFYQRR